MTNIRKIVMAILLIALVAIGVLELTKAKKSTTIPSASTSDSAQIPTTTPVVQKSLADPIADASTRVTKKPFGIYITPATSPVQPERFTGYHTGTDFETTPAEANLEVPFYAICDGKILDKRLASGYGGVFVQSCTINNRAVTVIYGHVSIKSISKKIGDTLAKGEKIGALGHSPDETDGERKHLHLGIHIGPDENIVGYVQTQSELSGWLDWQKLQ